jgi:pimeloyl-ACP methyl ester carboxylesterase
MTVTTQESLQVWKDQLRIRVQVAGSGPPLVYFHAAGGLQWDGFLDNMAENYAVYAPEHPGTSVGDPTAIEHVDDLWDLVLMYTEVLQALDLRAPVVIGQSFGGMVACELAACFPERVGRLVLLDPIGLWRSDAPVANWIAAPPDQLGRLLFFDPEGPVARAAFTLPEDQDAAISSQARLVWSLGCTGKFVWPIPDKGLAKRLHRITAPTLILWGHDDRLIPAVYAQEFGDRIANSRVEIIDQCGHVPQLEQQAETTRLVLAFLRG